MPLLGLLIQVCLAKKYIKNLNFNIKGYIHRRIIPDLQSKMHLYADIMAFFAEELLSSFFTLHDKFHRSPLRHAI